MVKYIMILLLYTNLELKKQTRFLIFIQYLILEYRYCLKIMIRV